MKKYITIAVIAVLFVGGFCYYKFASDFSYLGTTKGNVTSTESNGSAFTFTGKKGKQVKVFCNSSVKKGKLTIVLTNLNGKVIKKFKTNENYCEEVSLKDNGKYELSVGYDNFVGNFNVKCK